MAFDLTLICLSRLAEHTKNDWGIKPPNLIRIDIQIMIKGVALIPQPDLGSTIIFIKVELSTDIFYKRLNEIKSKIKYLLNSLPKTVEFFLLSFKFSGRNHYVFRSRLSGLFSLKLTLNHLKLESLCDVSITRIGDTLSYSFSQTVKGYNFNPKFICALAI